MSVTAVPLRPIDKGTLPKLWTGVALVVIAGLAFAWFTTRPPSDMSEVSPATFLAWNGARGDVVTTDSGLQYQILMLGDENGAHPGPTDVVVVNYTLRGLEGETYDEGQEAPLPVAGVWPGFAEGVQLMRPGDRYSFWLGSDLWYTPESFPPNAPFGETDTLNFEIELVEIISEADMLQRMMDMQQSQGIEAPPQ